MWSPERPAFLRQDGVLGVLAATPLGSITLGGSDRRCGPAEVLLHLRAAFLIGRPEALP